MQQLGLSVLAHVYRVVPTFERLFGRMTNSCSVCVYAMLIIDIETMPQWFQNLSYLDQLFTGCILRECPVDEDLYNVTFAKPYFA